MAEEKEVNLSRVKNKLVVMSGKGGVGKSTVSANLAVALAKQGFQVGLLDVDVHGPSIPKLMGLEGKKVNATPDGMVSPVLYSENLKVISVGFLIENEDSAVIWRGPMKYNAIKQFLTDVDWGELDYLIIDSPPGTGDEPLAVCQLVGENAQAVVVTTPQDVALSDVYKSINFCEKVEIPVAGVVENMSGFVCPKCGEKINIFGAGGGKMLAERTDKKFLGEVPIDPDIVKRGDSGTPFMASKSDSIVYIAFEDIVKKITE